MDNEEDGDSIEEIGLDRKIVFRNKKDSGCMIMTMELEERIQLMCNLSENVEARGIKKE